MLAIATCFHKRKFSLWGGTLSSAIETIALVLTSHQIAFVEAISSGLLEYPLLRMEEVL
jgi:hypothetical protein